MEDKKNGWFHTEDVVKVNSTLWEMCTPLQALLCFSLSDTDTVHCSLSRDLEAPRAAPQNTRHKSLRSHTAAANQAFETIEEASDVLGNRSHVNTATQSLY